jgi:UDP-2,3-diacylglucosamine hydrolase
MVYFLSDAHLGSKAIERGYAHQMKVCKLLRQMGKDATAIFLLGDMFDFWFEYYITDKSKAQYADFMHTIRHLINKGIQVHFFTGNHDIWTFGGLRRLTGMAVHHHPYVETLYGKKIYMAHGDGLLPSDYKKLYPRSVARKIRSFIRLRRFFHNPVPQFLFRCLPPKLGNKLGYGWAKKSRLKELANPCPYKGEDKEELVLFAKEKERKSHHDYYIFGHRHIDLDLQIAKDSRVIILGDCFKLFTYAKLDENGQLTLCQLPES